MAIPVIDSAKRIEQQFRTGEEPVLVMCSDVNIRLQVHTLISNGLQTGMRTYRSKNGRGMATEHP